jgi:hypothetical protein
MRGKKCEPTKGKKVWLDCLNANSNFSAIALRDGYLREVEILEFSFSRN